ncbi:hypothetical protein L3X38_022362 [Prunus dulcis]|uniref:Secreted protein n=1 Tax=Prunus dulcis TaxID=3755 RepID=A0AAD4VX19_PRUDU|nr:hypothetical protein L3X38_022362 [Prunus dulcis]
MLVSAILSWTSVWTSGHFRLRACPFCWPPPSPGLALCCWTPFLAPNPPPARVTQHCWKCSKSISIAAILARARGPFLHFWTSSAASAVWASPGSHQPGQAQRQILPGLQPEFADVSGDVTLTSASQKN